MSCQSVGSERPRAGHLLQGRADRGQHLQCLAHHVDLAGGLCRVVLVVGGEVGGGEGVWRVWVVVAGRL